PFRQAAEFGTTRGVVHRAMRTLRTWGYVRITGGTAEVAPSALRLAPMRAWAAATARRWRLHGIPSEVEMVQRALRLAVVEFLPGGVDGGSVASDPADDRVTSDWRAELVGGVRACAAADVDLFGLRRHIQEQLELERLRGRALLALRWGEVLELIESAGDSSD